MTGDGRWRLDHGGAWRPIVKSACPPDFLILKLHMKGVADPEITSHNREKGRILHSQAGDLPKENIAMQTPFE
jgi:hypothetical protein